MGIRTIVNFSLPPESVYEVISASDLLSANYSNKTKLAKSQQQASIIAPGDYGRQYQYDYPIPLALEYRCLLGEISGFCPTRLTTAEVRAYNLFHYKHKKHIILIPDIWLIMLGIIVAKGFKIAALSWSFKQRKLNLRLAVISTTLYILISLNLYYFAFISIPIILPSLAFWVYIVESRRRKSL